MIPTINDILDELATSYVGCENFEDFRAGIVCGNLNGNDLYYIIWQASVQHTKLHVEAALKEAAEKAEVQCMTDNDPDNLDFGKTMESYYGQYEIPEVYSVHKNSILTAYDLSNIK